MKLTVKTTTQRFWWGIYGLLSKNGYEDIDLFDEKGNLIDRIHLNTKGYLRAGLRFLKDDAQQLDYAIAIKEFLKKDKYHYWYYYDNKNNSGFYEVPYDAPKNKEGIKPKAIEIWHPGETIDIETIEEVVQLFSKKFLKVNTVKVLVEVAMSKEEAIRTYNSFQETEKKKEEEKIDVSSKLLRNLSKLWKNNK
ncbi:MAG: hypothetical protein AB8F74_04000 [Saprospiraceae bacterium]